MGSGVRGPGADASGPSHVAAPVARAWAVAAATAAVRVPAGNAEADAWTVRGWADVAVGCVALDGPGSAGPGSRLAWRDDPGAFSGLDEVIRSLRVVSGGQHAARLRQLRRFAGPVPPWYPDTQPLAGPIRGVRAAAWNAARLMAGFGEQLIAAADALPGGTACPLISAQQLSWGVRYRPSPSDGHVALRLPVNRRLARRTWMCLPGLPAPGTAIAEVPSTATAMAQQVWRGIHEGRTWTTSARWPGPAAGWRPARESSAPGCSWRSRTRWRWRSSPGWSASWPVRGTRCGSSAPG